jgi:hypothetical protein
MWSPGADQQRSGQNPVRAGGGTERGRRGVVYGLLLAGVGGWTGEKSGRQWPSAALPGSGRGSHCSGETELKAGHPAVAVGLVNEGASRDEARQRRPWRAAEEQGAEGERHTPPKKARGHSF